MNREDKIKEGQVQLNDRNKYRLLDKPMVETTAKKANALIKSLLQESYTDEMPNELNEGLMGLNEGQMRLNEAKWGLMRLNEA